MPVDTVCRPVVEQCCVVLRLIVRLLYACRYGVSSGS